MGITCLSSTSLAFFTTATLVVCLFGRVLTSPQNNNNSPTRSPFAKSPKDQPCSSNQQCAGLFNNTLCTSRGYCECSKDHVEYEGECLPVIPMYGDDLTTPPCQHDIQCQAELSRCNEESKKCECWDRNSNGRNATVHWRNYCYIKTGLGQNCNINEACKASIEPAGDVECDVRSRTCKCKEGKTCEDIKGGSNILGGVPSLTIFLSAVVAFKVFL